MDGIHFIENVEIRYIRLKMYFTEKVKIRYGLGLIH